MCCSVLCLHSSSWAGMPSTMGSSLSSWSGVRELQQKTGAFRKTAEVGINLFWMNTVLDYMFLSSHALSWPLRYLSTLLFMSMMLKNKTLKHGCPEALSLHHTQNILSNLNNIIFLLYMFNFISPVYTEDRLILRVTSVTMFTFSVKLV